MNILAFVVNYMDVVGELPVQIGPSCLFRRATPAEIPAIKHWINRSMRPDEYRGALYEGVWVREEYPGGCRTTPEPLPAEQWKYWVIAVEGGNEVLFPIQRLAMLLPVSLEIGFLLHYKRAKEAKEEGELAFYSSSRSSPLNRVMQHNDLGQLNATSLTQLSKYLELLEDLPAQHSFISTAIDSFSDLRQIPPESQLLIVGLFAIIESLVTHEPRKSETLDSIIHQIKNKMALLRKRYREPVPLTKFFDEAAEDTIWSRLYEYRSTIAHGSQYQFTQKNAVLRSSENVVAFLESNIKQLLFMTLADPEFFQDLRRC